MSTTDIQIFKPNKQQKFIFDTNVLIKLLYPTLSGKNTVPYEKLYQSIIKINAEIIVSSIQISEFVNRCIRFQFSLWAEDKDSSLDFKSDYRETCDYKESMQAILEIIKADILPVSTCIDDGFSQMHSDVLYQYGFSYDFNDSLVAEIARLNNAILITDDKDFGNYSSNIKIVTNNRALLMFH
ncbi:MAG: PIN domain-containing protein [Eubacterium sp.]|nr:PIN domain-containing protein [Eubacterium sp.]